MAVVRVAQECKAKKIKIGTHHKTRYFQQHFKLILNAFSFNRLFTFTALQTKILKTWECVPPTTSSR